MTTFSSTWYINGLPNALKIPESQSLSEIISTTSNAPMTHESLVRYVGTVEKDFRPHRKERNASTCCRTPFHCFNMATAVSSQLSALVIRQVTNVRAWRNGVRRTLIGPFHGPIQRRVRNTTRSIRTGQRCQPGATGSLVLIVNFSSLLPNSVSPFLFHLLSILALFLRSPERGLCFRILPIRDRCHVCIDELTEKTVTTKPPTLPQ